MATIGITPDAMSDVLSLVRMRGEVVCTNEFFAPWSVRFSKPVPHFHIVEDGSAWLLGAEHDAPVRLRPGDLVIVPLGAGHTLASEPNIPAVPIDAALEANRSRHLMLASQTADAARLVCGQFSFAGVLAPRLLAVLPPVIHIDARRHNEHQWLTLLSRLLVEEARAPRQGSTIMIARLLDLLFVQAIREWGALRPANLGWMSGLSDAHIGGALSVIHDDPSREWTVEALAGIACMSRSAFADRFRVVVGMTPLRYVTAWRLNVAADYLRASDAKIGDIATMVGYGSEAALTRAFKAEFGQTPGAFRRMAPISNISRSTNISESLRFVDDVAALA